MGKFSALATNTSDAFKMPIIDPLTDAVLTDKDGKQAFLSLLSADSDAGREIDRKQNLQQIRKLRSGRNLQDDGDDLTDGQIEKLVALTVGWYLVDPASGEALDVPFSKENAVEFYNDPGMAYLRKQAWVFVNTAGNFIKRSSKASVSSPSTNSAGAAG